jgi:hypothetical protein
MVQSGLRFSDASASVDKVRNLVGFIEVSINRRDFQLAVATSAFAACAPPFKERTASYRRRRQE